MEDEIFISFKVSLFHIIDVVMQDLPPHIEERRREGESMRERERERERDVRCVREMR